MILNINNAEAIYFSNLDLLTTYLIQHISYLPNTAHCYFTVLDDWDDFLNYSGQNYQSRINSPMFDKSGRSRLFENILSFDKVNGLHRKKEIYLLINKKLWEQCDVAKRSGSGEATYEGSPQGKETNNSPNT